MYHIIGFEGNEDPAAPAPYTYGAAAMLDVETHTLINAVTGSRSTRYHGGPAKSVYILPESKPLLVREWRGCYVARFRPVPGERPLWNPFPTAALDFHYHEGVEYAVFQDLDTLLAAATKTATLLLERGPKADEEKLRVLLALDHTHPRTCAIWEHRSKYRNRIRPLALAHVGEAGREAFLQALAELDAQDAVVQP